MKILYLAPVGSTTSIALKLQEEGHTVYFWDPTPGNTGEGNLKNIVDKWEPVIKKCDLVIIDNVDINIEKVRAYKKPTVGGNKLFSKLENDRIFGKKGFQSAGLTTSDCVQFTDFKKAMEFVKANPVRWVFKANGQASRTLGFVAKEEDGKDMLERLAFYESRMKNNKKLWDKKLGVDFVLEKAIDGIEVACGAYWDGQDFAGLNLNWEHKRLGVGNVGVATGEMGTAVHAITPETRLYRDTLAKLKPLLSKLPYTTYVDLNMIVTKDDAYVIEITSRMGYPMEAILDNMTGIATGTKYLALATGHLHEQKELFRTPWGIAVVGGTFGFPYEIAYDEYGANQPFSFDKKDSKNIYLDDVYKENNHLMTSSNCEGWIFTACGTSSTLSGAREKAFDIVDRVSLPGLMYRKDIGEQVPEHIKQLKDWKWI
jgi:phosphoribosylamine---glycine ligase